MCSGGGAMTGWNGSNFLFLVGGRRTCGQAQNMAKVPASWAQSRGLVEEENCLWTEHTHTNTDTHIRKHQPSFLEWALSYKAGILDHKFKHLHGSEIEPWKQVHKCVLKLSQTDIFLDSFPS